MNFLPASDESDQNCPPLVTIHDREHRFWFGDFDSVFLPILIRVPCALGFVKHNHSLHSRFVSFLQSFTNEHMDVLNECSDRALTPGFADTASVVTCDCSGNNFH